MSKVVMIMLLIASFLLTFAVSTDVNKLKHGPPGYEMCISMDINFPAIVSPQYNEYLVYEQTAILFPANLNPNQENVTQDRTVIYNRWDIHSIGALVLT